jgi:Rod binding domain-containing protein
LPDYINADAQLRDAAEKLEATFLSEMLKSAGLGTPRDAFGGGQGEEQFSSFLREAQAEELVKAGGIGLAESLFEAMKVRADA